MKFAIIWQLELKCIVRLFTDFWYCKDYHKKCLVKGILLSSKPTNNSVFSPLFESGLRKGECHKKVHRKMLKAKAKKYLALETLPLFGASNCKQNREWSSNLVSDSIRHRKLSQSAGPITSIIAEYFYGPSALNKARPP